jgi:hypothetical protein
MADQDRVGTRIAVTRKTRGWTGREEEDIVINNRIFVSPDQITTTSANFAGDETAERVMSPSRREIKP